MREGGYEGIASAPLYPADPLRRAPPANYPAMLGGHDSGLVGCQRGDKPGWVPLGCKSVTLHRTCGGFGATGTIL